MKPLAFTFDGMGINNANDPYKQRLATFTQRGHEMNIGPLLSAAPRWGLHEATAEYWRRKNNGGAKS